MQHPMHIVHCYVAKFSQAADPEHCQHTNTGSTQLALYNADLLVTKLSAYMLIYAYIIYFLLCEVTETDCFAAENYAEQTIMTATTTLVE